ncbi:hypothetical protein WMF31_11200 [Sorangium sp. So ce1036]|uniref:hypothetical protein n=1 Tax=Sorangium sp. So ce1036 TaxID=3133328 RepID=UPI003F0C42D2
MLDLSTHVRDDGTTDNEHDRWGEQVERVAALGAAPHDVVHVMDREGDDYGLFAQLLSAGHRFVIRLAHNRLVEADALGEEAKLEQALAHVQ